MRTARLSGVPRPLVLAVHGSADPRFAVVAAGLRDAVAELRPELPVRIGYLDHGVPELGAVVGAEDIVVPVLLSRGYHVLHDIPARAGAATVTDAVGPDPLVVDAVAERLREAGWRGGSSVALVAAGSEDARARADVRSAAEQLGVALAVDVTTAFIGSGTPRLSELAPAAVATYLLAPGRFADLVRVQAEAVGARVVSPPIGAHRLLAEVVLRRYDAAAQLPAQGSSRQRVHTG